MHFFLNKSTSVNDKGRQVLQVSLYIIGIDFDSQILMYNLMTMLSLTDNAYRENNTF